MDKFSENKLKQFSNFAGKYNTGKYAGREGFNKLAYELLAIFDCQGLPGAIVNYEITAEDVDTKTNLDAETTFDAMNQATKAVANLSDRYKKIAVRAEDARKSLATSADVIRRRSKMYIPLPSPILPPAGEGAAPHDEAQRDHLQPLRRRLDTESARRRPHQDDEMHDRRAADRQDGGGHHQDADAGEAKADGPPGDDPPVMKNITHANTKFGRQTW